MSVTATADTEVTPLVSARVQTPPSFSTFRFTTIGQQPKLLARMSTDISVQEEEDIYGDVEGAPKDASLSVDTSLVSTRSRPSLFEVLTSDDALVIGTDETANTSISGFNPLSASLSFTAEATFQPAKAAGMYSLFGNPVDFSYGASKNDSPTASFQRMNQAPNVTTTPNTTTQTNGHAMSRSLSPIIFANNDAVPSLETLLSIHSNQSSTLANMIPIDLSHAVSQCLSAKEHCAAVLESAKHAQSLSQQALQSAQASMEAAQQSMTSAEEIQDRVLKSLDAVQNLESVELWNTSIDKLKKNLLLVEKWASDKALYEDKLRREAEAREVERLRQEENLRRQTSQSTSTPSRTRAIEDQPTSFALRRSIGPSVSTGDISMGSIDEETSEAQRELAVLQEKALERKRLVEEKIRKQREEEELLEEEDRLAKEVAAARTAELVRRKAERELAEAEEREWQEVEEKRRLELEEKAKAAEAQRKLARERKIAEEKELKEKQALEALALKRQQEVARQRQLQTQNQPQRSSPQTSTNSRLISEPPGVRQNARKSASISPTTLTHPLPAIPFAAAAHANALNIGNVTSQATLTGSQKPSSQGPAKGIPSTKPLSSGSKPPPSQDPRLRHKAALSESKSAPSMAHTSPNIVQHRALPPEMAHTSTSWITSDAPTATERRSRSLSRPKVPSITSTASNDSDMWSKSPTSVATPATPSPTSDGQQMSLRNHSQDFGNLGIVLNDKVTPLSPEAQKANLRRVMEASRVKAEEKVKVEQEDLSQKFKIGPPRRRVMSTGAKVASETVPKPEIESPVMSSLPTLPQESIPAPAMQLDGSNRGQSQSEQRSTSQFQRQGSGPTPSHPPLPSRQGQRTRDPRIQSTSNNPSTSTSKPGHADQRTVHAPVAVPTLAFEAPTPAMKRASQTSTISEASKSHQFSTNPAISTSQPQGQRSPNMSMQEGMGPDPMTTGGWFQSAPSSSQEEDLPNDRRQLLHPPAVAHGREYDHYSPPPERAVPITRRPSNGSRILGDHYSPPPRVRPRSREPSPIYRGRRSPPPMSRVPSSGNRAFSPPPTRGMGSGRSRSPGPSSRVGGRSRSPRPYELPRPLSRDGPPALAGHKRTRDDELVAAPPPRRTRYSNGLVDRSNQGAHDANAPYNDDWSGVAVYNRSPSPPQIDPTSLVKRMAPTPVPPEIDQRRGSPPTSYGLASDSRAPLLARMDPTPEPSEDEAHWQTKTNHYRPPYANGDRFTGPNSRHYRTEHTQNRPPTLLSRFDLAETNPMEDIGSHASHVPSNTHYSRGGQSRSASTHPRGRGRGNPRGGGTGSADRFSGNNPLINRLQGV